MCYWIVDSVVARDSTKIPNSTCWHITLERVQTGEKRQTWIEETFKNARHWREIIERYPQGMIVYNVTERSTIIDADSKPVIAQALDRKTLDEEIKRYRERR